MKRRIIMLGGVIITLFAYQLTFAQGNTFKLDGNNNGTSGSKLGWKNHSDLNITTNDTSRILVKKDGEVEIMKNLNVKGEIFVDSIRIAKYLTADSIHVRSIKIGDSSLWIGNVGVGTNDLIQSNHQAISFGRMPGFPTDYSQIRLGVGTQNPFHKMQLYDRSMSLQPVRISFTNNDWIGPPYTGGTGSLATDGFLVGIAANGDAEFRQQEFHPIRTYINDGTITQERSKMYLYSTIVWPRLVTRMTLNLDGYDPIINPVAMLHMGHNIPTGGGGNRDWMNTGTYCAQDYFNMYIGLKHTGVVDRKIATIDWGDNLLHTSTSAVNVNVLSIVFTGLEAGAYGPNSNQGLEVMRMIENGRVGIGPTFILDEPKRRLEVIDKDGPQLRLSVDQHFSGGNNSDVFTDFWTQGNGDLWINPTHIDYSPSGFWQRNVCINFPASSPSISALDVNGHATIRDLSGIPTTSDFVVADANGTLYRGVPSVSFGGICGTSPPALTNNWEIPTDVFTYNFSGKGWINMTNATSCGAQQAKLTVNDDFNAASLMVFNNHPAIGNVAGFFQATPVNANAPSYAIIVPPQGGSVGIGMLNPTASLSVNGKANCLYSTWSPWSDSLLKTDIEPYREGLSLVKLIKPVSYKYNGLGGLSTDKKHIGIIAEQLALVAPYMVDTVQMVLDTATNVETSILTFNADAFFYMSINAIKQLDSAVTVLQNNPGVSGSGTANYITKWQNANTVTTSQVQDNGTNVWVGTPVSGPALNAKLSVSVPDTTPLPFGFVVDNSYNPSNPFSDQVYGGAIFTTANNNVNVGFQGYAANANYNIGGGFYGTNNTLAPNPGFNTGVFCSATGSSVNYGLRSEVGGGALSNEIPMTNYGVYSNVIPSPNQVSTNYGIYANGGNPMIGLPGTLSYAGYFNGDVYSSGTYLGSDIMLKDNVAPLSNAISIINQLQPKTFTFKTAQYPQMNLPTGSQFGLVAQDVEPILPNMVKEVIQPAVKDSAGNIITPSVTFKSIKYEPFIPILIQGMKEEHSSIDSLKTQIADLQNQVAILLGNNGGNAKILNTINVELANDAVLYQNIPNPFGEETMINYYIPENNSNAKIIFFDMYGQSMKEVPLTETGSGNIHVDSKNLASGIYSYSLIINGKVIDTKKMVKSK